MASERSFSFSPFISSINFIFSSNNYITQRLISSRSIFCLYVFTHEKTALSGGLTLIHTYLQNHILNNQATTVFPKPSGQALDRLVSVSSMYCCTSTSDLSTSSSSRGLTRFCDGISHLEGGFTLRCLQRLSRPDLATLPWLGRPTGTPAVCPSRSSRTKDSSSQISYARAG